MASNHTYGVVGNRDRCGRCHTRHGGNNHRCDVHGPVSLGCCEPRCNLEEWVLVEREDQLVPVSAGHYYRLPDYYPRSMLAAARQ